MKIQKKQSQTAQSVATYTFKHVLITFVLLSIFLTLFVTVFGIHHTFMEKKREGEEYALMLARSAGMPYGLGVKLSADQSSKIIKDDSLIYDINFYSFQHQLEIVEPSNNYLFVSLIQDYYDINQSIVYHDDLDKNLLFQLSDVDIDELQDDTITGYINIKIDIAELRRQWVKAHFIMYAGIWLSCLLLCLWFLRLRYYSIAQAKELQFIANKLLDTDENGFLALPLLKKEIKFTEFADIQSAFISIVEEFNELKKQNNELRLLESRLEKEGTLHQLRETKVQKLITYELENSLGVIQDGVKTLGQQYLLDEQKDALSLVRKGSQQVRFILDQIAYFQQIEKGELNVNRIEFSPLQFISDLVAKFQVQSNEKGIELLSNVSHVEHNLEGDIDKIQTILYTLVGNAIEFTREGSITIESDLQHFNYSTRWTVKIKDTGVGIAEKDLENIFEPFIQLDDDNSSKHRGIGIGLTIAKQLAEAMDASLRVSSTLHEGSTFELVVPLFDKTQLIERQYLQGINITYIQKGDCQQLMQDLCDFGANSVSCFHNTDEALDVLMDEPTDVLIISSDLSYQQVVSFVTSFRDNETNHRSLIIWLADFDMGVTEEKMQSIGIDVLLAAPFDKKDIATTIKNWLR